VEVLTLAEWGRWERAVKAVPGWDVYWLPGYARFWEACGDGEALLALLEADGERVAMVCLRRPVPDTDWWDLATPYGYGGHLASPGAAALIPAFWQQCAQWAAEGGAVSAFTRFHPLLGNHATAPDPSVFRAPTVFLDLTAGPVAAGFKAEVRNRMRRAERAGLTVRLTEAPREIGAFLGLYHQTMARRQAAEYYHFADAAFAGLLGDLSDHLLLAEVVAPDGQVAAAALFLYNDEYLHYHLGGSDPAWLRLAPNNLLFGAAARWGQERGVKRMHLGGGVRPGDSLLRFKAGFSPLRAEFHVGHHIINPAAYRECTARHLERLGGRPPAPGWFPAYRAPAAPEAVEVGS
jgi:serine/alanine adding enzyme